MSPRKALVSKAAGKRLAKLRAGLDLSQHAMAKKLGVKPRMYQYYEAGRPYPETVAILISLIEDGKY